MQSPHSRSLNEFNKHLRNSVAFVVFCQVCTEQLTERFQGTTFYGTHDAYTGGGYVQTLNGSAEELHTAFTRLEKENWIDEGTRAVFIEFSAYNVQTNHFSVIQLALEMPPFGKR